METRHFLCMNRQTRQTDRQTDRHGTGDVFFESYGSIIVSKKKVEQHFETSLSQNNTNTNTNATKASSSSPLCARAWRERERERERERDSWECSSKTKIISP